jgi:hypothetical protein
MRKLIPAMLIAIATPAIANDSTATVGTGGLVLQKSGSIAMVSEDLYVSVNDIRVGYIFRNVTAVPVTTVVAFPMPPRSLSDEYGGDVAYPSNFRTSVDGQPIKLEHERKAVVDGKDFRDRLDALGVPVAPATINAAIDAMDRLPPARKAELVRLGLAGEEEYDDDGKGMKKHLIPLWNVEDKYWWTQTFVPGRNVRIDHRYVPGAGGSVESAIAFPQFRNTDDTKAMIAEYCIDKAFIAAVDKRSAKGADEPMMPERNIDYILTTGGNWAKPIGTFRLVVDKGAAKNLVSFCGDGIKKIGSTQFEVVKKNWRPTSDLHVLIIEPRS